VINIFLKDVAQKENFSVQSDSSIKNLVDLMNINQKGVVVILEDENPVGILTERDIVEVLYRGGSLDETVNKYTKKTLVTTFGERTVGYALNLTLENNIRRVIVVDDSNRFHGIVTQQDLLKYLEEDFYRLSIKVKHIVRNTGGLLSAAPENSLHDVLKLLAANKISAVPIIENQKPVGIISEKDILRLAGEKIPLDSTAGEHMTSPVDTARLGSLLVEIVEVMNYKKIRRVVVVDEEGSAINVVSIRDVIENLEGDYNKFLERKLQSAKEILNLLPDMLIEVTDTGKEQLIIWANDKALNKFGSDMLDKPVNSFFPSETWDNIYSTLKKLNKIDHIKLKKDDRIYELSGFFVTTFGKMEQGRFQMIMRDITEDIKLSTTDPLTEIYNRRFLNEFMMKELERSRRMNSHFSLVISDIDDFKIVNDSYGHLAGDTVLKVLARTITETVRNLDVVGRYGGDEFMLILPDADKETALSIISRLRENVENMDIPVLNDVKAKITVSFGIASFPENGTSLDDLLIEADKKLYKAKGLGKNQIG
jgi:diguanylate cyclase (GGDEF)-like protein